MQCMARHEDGVMISELEWKDICQSVAIIACSHMEPLKQHPCAIVGKMHKKGFIKKTFPDVWYEALIALKSSAPSLSLCALNWKADMVLGAVLDKSSDPDWCSHPRSQSQRARPAPRQSIGAIQAHHSETGSVQKSARVPAGHLQVLVQPPSPHPAFMSLVQPDTASQPPPSSEPALPKTLCAKQDNATLRAKAPSTRAKGKGKDNPATMTDGNDNMASQPVSKSRLVTPVDPGCQSPRWGAQVQVRLATSSFEVYNTFQARPRHVTPQGSINTQSAKAKGSRPTMTDDDNIATQSQSKSRSVTPVSDPGCKSPRWGAQDPAGKVASSSLSSEDSGSDDNLHSHLQALQCDELMLWVEEHKIESQDLIDTIAGAPKSEQPSKEDIEGIIKERKSKRITKAA
ncbi:hypothetical protein EDB89DRAFT_1903381 [Lactarius sanguifluus]|nr:hypothetical protein EDB89DRAFT_1903381 [Lactarius sanguifluus]